MLDRTKGLLLTGFFIVLGGSRIASADSPARPSAAVHVARAEAHAKAKDYDRAIAECTEAIRIDPKCGEAYAWRGGSYLGKRVNSKAIADYTLALRYAPKLTWARCGRGEAYRRRGESARALADLEEALRNDPQNEQAHYNRCLVYLMNLRDCERAIAESSERIRRHPKEAMWYMLRSVAYLAKGETAKSLKDGTTAVSLNPGNVHLHGTRQSNSLLLGFSFSSTADDRAPWEDDSQKRIAACTKRLTDDPDNVAAYYERACAYIKKCEYNQAIADFDEIIRRDPADAEAFRSRGHQHVNVGAYTEALDDYANAMRLDPGNADDYGGRARAYGGMLKYQEALRDCTKAIQLDPRFVYPHTIRGWVHECIEKYDLATADYSEAIRLSPADSSPYLRRADARCNAGDFAGGIADYKQAIKLAPANSYACARLAAVLSSCWDARLRDGEEARKLATTACEATSWRDWYSLASLALACAECGDFDEAVKWETKAGELAPDGAKSQNQERLKLYRAHKPYHVTPPKGASGSPSSK